MKNLARGKAAPSKLNPLLEEAWNRFWDENFQKYNKQSRVLDAWEPLIDKSLSLCKENNLSKLSSKENTNLIEVLIAFWCMPNFQHYYLYDHDCISPSYFKLFEADGGLTFFLSHHSPPFHEQLFENNLQLYYPEYHYGDAMAIFTDAQVEEFWQTLCSTASLISDNSDNEELSANYHRLSRLVNQARTLPGHTLSLTEQ